MNRIFLIGFASCILLASKHLSLAQGSLTPPGAPAATMKSLDQIEPRKPISSIPIVISSAGSYYLTTNLTGATSQGGITISADNVTLDLNGCSLTGGATSLVGILLSGGRQNIAIRNGSLNNWAGGGIVGSNSTACLYEQIRVTGNTLAGISVGVNSVLRGCVAVGNGLGIIVSNDCAIVDCNASGNSNVGIRSSGGATISHSTTSTNGNYGIAAGSNSSIQGCTVRGNGNGGIGEVFGGLVKACEVEGNAGNGIEAQYYCTVSDCNVTRNTSNGIYMNNFATALNNTCMGNGTAGNTNLAGILSQNNNNHIEGNRVEINNTRGIKLNFNNNYVVRNIATGNTVNYDFGTNSNTTAPVINNTGLQTNSNSFVNIVY